MKGLDQATIAKLLADDEADEVRNSQRTANAMYRHGFDRAALFLLSMRFDNLFEPWVSEFRQDADGWWWRCKGCSRMVKRTGRESHHEWHRRELL